MSRTTGGRLALALVTLMGPTELAFGVDTPVAEDRREVLESLLRDELAKALAPPFRLEGSETKEIRFKSDFPRIDEKIGDYRVAARVEFPDAARELELKVESLVVRDERSLVGRLSASCPARGALDAAAGPISGHADFSAIAAIPSIAVEADWATDEAGNLTLKPRVTALTTEVRDVRFRGDLEQIFGGINDLARDAANSWLKQNESRFKDELNKALDKALRDGRLRMSPDELVR